MTDDTSQKSDLIPLTDWPNHFSYPPVGQLRNLVFNAEKNGFHKVVRRIGKRVLLNPQKFHEWVEEQNYNQDRGA